MKQIENLLDTFELRLLNFQQILPGLDKRRGMLNHGGTSLKALFGTVRATDLHQLHGTIEELKSKKSDIAYLLANQQTYVRGLDHTTRINTDVISSLSAVVKHELVQSHDRYVQLTRDMWLNLSMSKQSRSFMVIRQLDFTLLQLTHQIDKLLMVMQYTLSEKLP